MNGDELAQKVLKRYQQLTQKRDAFKDQYKLICKYILMRPVRFGDASSIGRTPKFSIRDVADDEVIEAARTASTALGGALWPHAADSFELVPAPHLASTVPLLDGIVGEQDEIKDYFERVTRYMRDIIDAPESGFLLAWSEYMDDQPTFGTGGIAGIERENDDVQPVQFRSVSVESAVIDEGADGIVNTVYLEFCYTVRQLVEKYGIDKVSEKSRDCFEGGKEDDFVRVIQAVEPRMGGKIGAEAANKPIASIHVEVDACHTLKNSGFDEMPIQMTRFRKLSNEVYGRSLAMDAIPTLKELNVLRQSFSKALHKLIEPPVGFWSEMIGGGGTIDLSPNAKVPLYNSGRIPQGQRPVEQLITVQEPRVANDRLEKLVERIKSKFLVDRLLDFNNKTRMTLGEAELRNDFRNQALNNIFVRQIVELLAPLIKWTFKVLWRRNLVGLHPDRDKELIASLQEKGENPLVIPRAVLKAMMAGVLPFNVRFISPAARAMKAESLVGVEKLTNYAFALTNAGVTDAMDNIDTDKAVRTYQDLVGAPSSVLRGKDEVQKQRKARQQELAARAQAQEAEIQAKAAAHGAKAIRDVSAAGGMSA